MSVVARTRERPVSRISISLPEELLCDLDRMVERRGFDSRSQAVNDMLHCSLVEHKHELGDDVMVGIIALFYNNAVPGLQKQLADLQVRYIDEVMRVTGGNRVQAARILGIDRKTLYRWADRRRVEG